MPSPFPGMDPYLEHPDWFRGLRFSLVVALSHDLQSALPEPYYSDIRPRRWIEDGRDESDSFVEIRSAAGECRRVTVIEILDPDNKMPGTPGRGHYLDQQNELLTKRINLVEIDLLRGGHHSTAVLYNEAVAKTGRFDYHVRVPKMPDREPLSR